MNIALILCAGLGRRMNVNIPKQFLKINKKPLFIHTLDRFMNSSLVDKIVLVINKNDEFIVKDILKKQKYEKELIIAYGGKTRQKSVFFGLKSIEKIVKEDDIILIHDGARANVSNEIIKRNIETVKNYGTAVTAIKITDTIAEKNGFNLVAGYLDRENLVSIQTPQSFYFKDIFEAHEKCALDNYYDVTDDSSIAKYAGLKVKIVEGSRFNIKVTTQEDLDLLGVLLKNNMQ